MFFSSSIAHARLLKHPRRPQRGQTWGRAGQKTVAFDFLIHSKIMSQFCGNF
jgi:hypothetical protein